MRLSCPRLANAPAVGNLPEQLSSIFLTISDLRYIILPSELLFCDVAVKKWCIHFQRKNVVTVWQIKK
jgi:hypothetical protein